MNGEEYLRRSELIKEMKQLCIDNKIFSFADFCIYCKNNNEEWHKELLQVCKYLII